MKLYKMDLYDAFKKKILDKAIGPFPKVGDFQPICKSVITIVTHQRVGIKNNGANATNNHDAQCKIVYKRIVWGIPPYEGSNRSNDKFDINTSSTNNDAVPFVRKSPSIGNISVKSWGKTKEEHAHFMHFTSKLFTT